MVILWMVVIFAFSHQPYSGAVTEPYLGMLNVPVRKLAHITEYAVLFILVRRAIDLSLPTKRKKSAFVNIFAFLIAFLYALSDEWHQSIVPGRSATFSDVCVDMCGAAAGFLVALAARMSGFDRGCRN